jgi:hypothetical protein
VKSGRPNLTIDFTPSQKEPTSTPPAAPQAHERNPIMANALSVIYPTLHLGTLQPSWPLLADSLGSLCASDAGELLGFALGHGVGARYIGGACTEYLCAYVGTGDRRSVDGAVFQLQPAAYAVIKMLDTPSVLHGNMARLLRELLGCPGPEFESIHFRDFMVAILRPLRGGLISGFGLIFPWCLRRCLWRGCRCSVG